MGFLYSFEAASWYHPDYNAEIPVDAVKVEQSLRDELLAGVGIDTVIVKGKNGMPELGPRPPAPPDQLMARERRWRDAELAAVMWLRERHRDQLEIEAPVTLTGEQFKELLLYMQALRDWPQSADFPDVQRRPSAPPWIAEQTQ
ncbi:phage tail assembly chaperone [Pseudomonas sp. Au-Pse12]|uniref:phage tail assembly chaperone n=1 Tax=Pseudomonas sp. Au-Pse12 TaxID=2906459 RepID=UPI001E5B071E|nr:phage tail assembly chaperone [Pseudomonas sp. Au-Pse12]MCE4058467.1 phage tail assembly chaperone [Pseudomonas sp. Au-Pse12]